MTRNFWWRRFVPVWFAFAFLACLAGCKSREEVSDGAQLILSTTELQPGTTFELRLDQPMARANQVAVEDAESPLEFSPTISGKFIWKSSRSGVFTPDQPLALGTKYQITLRDGLSGADGKPARARLRRTVETPEFGVANRRDWGEPQASTNAYSEPEFRLWFNASVKAAEAGRFAGFYSEGGWVPAIVTQGTREKGEWISGQERTWEEQFREMRRDRSEIAVETHSSNAIPNLLIARPLRPLTAAKGWRFVLSRGVRSADGRYRMATAYEVPIGDVRPFELEEAALHNVINRGPWLELKFTKALNSSLTNTFTNWVTVAPEVGLEAEVRGSQLLLRGDWVRGTNYSAKVLRGFPAEEAFALAETRSFDLAVPPVDPRIYFPEFSAEQLASGRRVFPLLLVNVDSVRVRAKLLDPGAAIHALHGYESYQHYEGEWPAYRQNDRRLNYDLVAGHTVFAETLPGANAPDVARQIPLSWDRLLAGRKTGVVFLEAERAGDSNDHGLGTQALIQLTDLGMVWKSSSSEGQVQVQVFSYATGEPVAGARVRLHSNENEPLAESSTDEAGVARLEQRTNSVWLTAELLNDFHAVRLDKHNIPSWMFNLHRDWGESEVSSYRVMLFTDRDVYRPGEAVHLKAIAREFSKSGLSIPAGATGLVACANSEGREFFSTNAILSSLGSCAMTIPLPPGSRGDYPISLRLGGSTHEHRIKVQDYQPNAFEITLPAKAAYEAGEKIELPVSARYLFGQRLQKANVHWSLEASDAPFQSKAFEKFSFSRTSVEDRWGRGPSSVTLNGQGTLLAGSNFLLRTELPLNSVAPQPRSVSLLVEVTDLNQQTLTRSASFVAHSSRFYLGLRQFEEVLKAGEALPVEIAAVGSDDHPWTEEVKAHLTLQRIVWQTTRIEGAGHAARYHTEATFTNILEKGVLVSPPELTKLNDKATEWRGAQVKGIVAPEAGEYLLEVKGHDPTGREVASSSRFYVTEPGRLAWDYRNEVEIKLVPDNESYQVGEKALILVKTPISGNAWVTVEREGVLRSFNQRLEGNAPSFELPIQAGDAPNVFVSVTLVRGANDSPHQAREPEYRVGYCQLKVEDPATKLSVEVHPVSSNCVPGAAVTATALVKDGKGQPVPDAEVTLYAVDEGVLGLTDYETPDPHHAMFAERSLGINSGITLPFLLTEDPERLTFQNKGYLGGGGGMEGLRHRFLACAYWNADLRTGPEGTVKAEFVAPDSITRYRLIAVAQAAPNRFGSGQASISVSKPVMIEPSLPRFANVSDRVQARGVVLNQTDSEGEVLVSLTLDEKAVATESPNEKRLEKRVHIAAHGAATVEFALEFKTPGTAQWIWKARFEDTSICDFADAVQSTLEVGTVLPLLRDVQLVEAKTAETNLLPLLNPQVLSGQGTLKVTVANSRLVELSEAIASLLHYPYGCVEQTSSSMLPWLLLQEAPELITFTQRTTNDAAAAIQTGLRRLWSMQTSSGGLAYWPGGREPMLWASAYGGMVMAMARQAGVPVPEKEFDRVMDYLSKALRTDGVEREGLGDQCLALYTLALAGRAEPAYHEKLFGQRGRLSPENRALLALAVATSHGERGMVPELLHPGVSLVRAAEENFSCPARSAAIRLLTLLASRPGDAETGQLAGQLLNLRTRGHWSTTQGDAWALLALCRYFRQNENVNDSVDGSLTWGDQKVPFALRSGQGVFSHTFALNPALMSAPFELRKAGGKRLYAQLVAESRSPETRQTRQDHGLRLERRYERLNDNNQPETLDKARVGDRVLVTLRLTVHENARYVALDDPLPAVFEAVNSEFKTQQLPGGALPRWMARDESDYWWSDFREIRNDRVLFFANDVGPGNYVIRYVARVRAAGTATAPPAKAEEMYHPDRFGLTETQSIASEASL